MCFTGRCPYEMHGNTDTAGSCGYPGDLLKDKPCRESGELLTLHQLKDMEPGVFASGNALEGHRPFRWVATRAKIHDWAIYIGERAMSNEDILRYGNKLHDDGRIRELVPCDDEAFKMYRH